MGRKNEFGVSSVDGSIRNTAHIAFFDSTWDESEKKKKKSIIK
jgi:hypothetical protein